MQDEKKIYIILNEKEICMINKMLIGSNIYKTLWKTADKELKYS